MRLAGLTNKLDRMFDACLALVYPQACLMCGASIEERACAPACAKCWQETELFSIDDAMCWKCGAPAAGKLGSIDPQSIWCRRCETESWTAARAIGRYDGALKAAVLELKHRPFVGERIIELMRVWLRSAPLDAATLVVPVPLHPKRERERGFNQAAVIGETLARRAGLPFDDASLARSTYLEAHRAGMDAEGRRESVAGVFEIVRPRMIEGESVLLVDDVWTTGATASACAAPLTAAGAREVFVLTLARAGIG